MKINPELLYNVLYSSGERKKTYTLSDNVSNYSYIEIVGKWYTGATFSVIVPSNIGEVCVSGTDFNGSANQTSGNIYTHIATLTLSGTTLTFKTNGWYRGTTYTVESGTTLYIYRVAGYK